MVPIGEPVEPGHRDRRLRRPRRDPGAAVKANGDKRVFRVLLRNGSFIEVTADHLVYAVPERRSVGSWLRVDQLRPGMRLHLYPHRQSADDPVGPLCHRRAAGRGRVAERRPWSVPSRLPGRRPRCSRRLQADGFVGQYAAGTTPRSPSNSRPRPRRSTGMGVHGHLHGVPPTSISTSDLRDRRHHPHRASHPALRRGPTAVRGVLGPARPVARPLGCRPGSGTRPTRQSPPNSQHLPG